VIQHNAHPPPLLVRPGVQDEPLSLDGPVRALNRAARAAHRCGVPIDAALATTVQLTCVAPDATEEAIRDATVALKPAAGRLSAGETRWIRQLRVGCSWYEHTLPVVWLPASIIDTATPEQVLAGVLWAADELRLRTLLDLECAAMRARVPLEDALARLRPRA
jgi:hypothetical protein